MGSLSGVSVGLTHSSWGSCAGSVCVYGGSLSGVSVGLSRSLWGYWGPVLDHCGYMGGPCLGRVWVSPTLHGPLRRCPLCTSRQEKGGTLHVRLLAVLSVPSVSCLQTGTLVPAPPTQRSPPGASERTWQQPGSGSKLCAPLS